MIDKERDKKDLPKKGFCILLIGALMLVSNPFTSFASNECPKPRKTKNAPEEFLGMKNPLSENAENIKAGEDLFQGKATPIACKTCHGIKGNGKSEPGFESTPLARNFTCAKTMKALPDGQLFWVIKKGSQGTAMFSFSHLSDNEI